MKFSGASGEGHGIQRQRQDRSAARAGRRQVVGQGQLQARCQHQGAGRGVAERQAGSLGKVHAEVESAAYVRLPAYARHLDTLDPTGSTLRRAVTVVALANLAYFFVEFAVARRIGSVSLFADSVDFLEDATVNFLIVAALGWSARDRARVGMLLAAVLLVPALALLWTACQKFNAPLPPDSMLLSATGLGALFVNVGCALLLARFRHASGSLTRVAFLSARNDAFANIAIVVTGLIKLRWASAWPDLVVGRAIAAMNADAAKSIWRAARDEHAAAAKA
ncbi:MAG TPA: cation transporter [Burkholderiaceae bacterium]|nr:cation transporter [Burkholderiaceae bacterium]